MNTRKFKAPFDLYGGEIPKGTIYVKHFTSTSYLYYPENTSELKSILSLPQEIVEQWEEVFDEEKKSSIELIESHIIEQLNLADKSLNREEFERLSESIIDYIDEIKNGTNIAGATSVTYTTTTLANGDIIRVVLMGKTK